MNDGGKLLLSEREAARALGVSARHLYTLRKRGEVPFVLLGQRVLYSPAALQGWIRERSICGSRTSEGADDDPQRA
ncbi:hypothetical protein JCM19992_22090 [Thermostilla marina]